LLKIYWRPFARALIAPRRTRPTPRPSTFSTSLSTFNFQSKIQVNYDSLNAKAGQLNNFGLIINPSQRGFLHFRQVKRASTYEWGRDFCPAIQAIHQKFPYNYIHTDARILEMLNLFANDDAVRNLLEAPSALPESALAVDLVAQLLNEREVYSDDDTIKQASAVLGDSGKSRHSRNNNRRTRRSGKAIAAGAAAGIDGAAVDAIVLAVRV
jgi:hypothetical protein